MNKENWTNHTEEIRSKEVENIDPQTGEKYTERKFQIFKRPYFYGLIGKKTWSTSITTNSPSIGFSFSKSLL